MNTTEDFKHRVAKTAAEPDEEMEIEVTPKGVYALQLIANGMSIEQAEIEANARFAGVDTERKPQ